MLREIDAKMMQTLFVSGAYYLDNNKQVVNDLNVFPVPDGDTGTNMSMTVLAAEKALQVKNCTSAGEVVSTVASATLRGARGNSGVILSQIMRGFASSLSGKETVLAADFIHALSCASKTAYRAVMKPTEGTILTVIRKIAEAMESLDEDDDILSLLEAVVTSGNQALMETPKLLPVLKKAGVVDAGGKGLMLIFEGMLYAVQNGQTVERIEHEAEKLPKTIPGIPEKAPEAGYCTEFLIRKNNPEISGDIFKSKIINLGESVLVIDDFDIIKVHIHTDHPGKILEMALSFGMLSDIKIDNLREQQEERLAQESISPKKYGIISVCAGDGVCSLMREMGADVIVSGGQTMNPSAEDILAAINTIPAEKVFILPNNSNIVLTAEQAADMTERDVKVIKTKTIPQGIAALMAFDADSVSPEEAMADAAVMVGTGLLTNAVRDTEIDSLSIHKNDYLGLCDGEIVASGEDEKEVMFKIFENLMSEDSFAVTILYGDQIEKDTAMKYEELIAQFWPEAEVTILYGGQPVYHYIISVE